MRRPARIAKVRPDRRRQIAAAGPSTAVLPRVRPVADLMGLLQAAVGHHQAGDAVEAERLYRQVLDLDPEQADALHLLGVLALQAGRADLAVSLIQRAIQNRPAAPGFHLNLGNALLALGRGDEVVGSYRQATVLASADPEAHYNLGNALLRGGDVEAGIAELRQAVRLRPEHAGAQYNVRAGEDPLATGLPLPATLIDEPAVLAALPRVVICAPDLERVLTALRRWTLLRMTSPPSPLSGAANHYPQV